MDWLRRIERRSWLTFALYAGLCLTILQIHVNEIDLNAEHYAENAFRHFQIVHLDPAGESPWAYRLLTPLIAEVFVRFLQLLGFKPEYAVANAYIVVRSVFTLSFFVLFERWMRRWVRWPWAVAGTLMVVALEPSTYRFYGFEPDSPLDLLVWTSVAVLTIEERFEALPWIVAVGTFNRETALFAVLVHVALRWGQEPRRDLLVRAAQLFACWLVPFVGLRVGLGLRPWSADLFGVMGNNLSFNWAMYALGFLGAMCAIAFVRFRRRPPALQRLIGLLILTYVPMQFVFGRIREVRLFLPLALALVPLAMLTLQEAGSEADDEATP